MGIPPFAYKALQAEENIGTMLPCNVIVQESTDGKTSVAAINPLVSMQAVNNRGLAEIANEVATRLQRVVDSL